MKKLSILGSTGSIGVSTLEIVAARRDRFDVVALTGGNNLELLGKTDRGVKHRLRGHMEESAKKLASAEGAGKTELLRDSGYDCGRRRRMGHGGGRYCRAAGLVPTVAGHQPQGVALANKVDLVSRGVLSWIWRGSGECASIRWIACTARFINHFRDIGVIE